MHKMDIDDLPTNLLPEVNPPEMHEDKLSEDDTTELCAIPLLSSSKATHRRLHDPSQEDTILMPATPSQTLTFGERQRSSLLKYTLLPIEGEPTDKQISLALAELIEHREQIARQE